MRRFGRVNPYAYHPGHDAPPAPTWRPVKFTSPERCAKKIRHATWAEAEQHVYELIEHEHEQGTPRLALGLVAYRCARCTFWHVGHGIGTPQGTQHELALRRRALR